MARSFRRVISLAELSADSVAAINRVIKEEAGYTQNKNDSGNFCGGQLIGTKYGITPSAYSKFYGGSCPTPETIKNLTPPKAIPIYRANYWSWIRGDEIKNPSVADLMLFILVNSGTGLVRDLKRIANQVHGTKIMAEVAVPFTAQEIKLLNGLDQDRYFSALKRSRENFYRDLVKKKPSKSDFLEGWLSRLEKHKYSGKRSAMRYAVPVLIGAALVGGGVWYLTRHHRHI